METIIFIEEHLFKIFEQTAHKKYITPHQGKVYLFYNTILC